VIKDWKRIRTSGVCKSCCALAASTEQIRFPFSVSDLKVGIETHIRDPNRIESLVGRTKSPDFTMSNVHGLFSAKKDGDEETSDDENNRFVGGIGDHGGGRYGGATPWERKL